jgi:hypothetical protein
VACPGRHPSPEKSGQIDVENLFRLVTSFSSIIYCSSVTNSLVEQPELM